MVVPAGEPLLEPHLRADQHTVTFGEGGDVELVGRAANGEVTIVDRARGGGTNSEGRAGGKGTSGEGAGGEGAGGEDYSRAEERIAVRPSFAQSHNLRNLLAATAAARALGVTPTGGWTWSSRRCAANAWRWQTESC